MGVTIDVSNGNPYDTIAKIVEEWCEQNYYTNFLVTLAVDAELSVEFLEFNGSDYEWLWNNDWWEGESRVELIGFIPQEDILVEGTPDSYIFLKDKTEEKSMQNYEAVRKFLKDVPTDIAGRIKEEFFGWPKGTPVQKIEEWFDKKKRGESTRK